MTPNEVRVTLQEQLKQLQLLLEHGCLDGYCEIERTRGQHTNGGCRCWKEIKRGLLDAAVLSEEVPAMGDRFCYEDRRSV